jgi:hypothetical protein
VLVKKEEDYAKMGISLDLVRSSEKLYLYNTDTIRDRIDVMRESIEGLTADIISVEEAEILLTEYLSRKSLIVDFGAERIRHNLGVALSFGSESQWHEALASSPAKTDREKIGAALYNLLKAKPKLLADSMEKSPNENVFMTARRLVTQLKSR